MKKQEVCVIASTFQFLGTEEYINEHIEKLKSEYEKIVFVILNPYVRGNSEFPLNFDMINSLLNLYHPNKSVLSCKLNLTDLGDTSKIKNVFNEAYPNTKHIIFNLDIVFKPNYNINETIDSYYDEYSFNLGRRVGAIETATAGYPKTIMCVDVAILSENNSTIWLGKRNSEDKYRFIGGHVDSGKDLKLESAAKRELMEEAGSFESSPMEYVWGGMINDPRYLNSKDHIYSVLYKTNIIFGRPIAGDDINIIEEFDIKILQKPGTYFVVEHVEMANALKLKLFGE